MRLAASLGLAALLLAGLAHAQENPPKSVNERARDALTSGKPDDAIALVDPIIAKAEASDAKDADSMCPGVAVAVLSAFMARQNPNIVISAGDDWCEAMFLKGYALAELKRSEQAAAVLGKLVKHDPDNPNYQSEYAYVLQSSGKMDDSMAAYKKVVRISEKLSDKPNRQHWRAVGLRGIGYIYSDRQQWNEAVKAYQESLKAEPDNKVALGELDYIARNRTIR